MKTLETSTVAAPVANNIKPTTVKDLLNEAKTKNPDSGSLELDAMQKTLKISRFEIVTQARNAGGGSMFKTGSKGHSSVLLYGQAAKDFLTNRNTNQKPHARKVEKVQPQAKTGEIHFPTLRLSVGGQIINVPISAELIAA